MYVYYIQIFLWCKFGCSCSQIVIHKSFIHEISLVENSFLVFVNWRKRLLCTNMAKCYHNTGSQITFLSHWVCHIYDLIKRFTFCTKEPPVEVLATDLWYTYTHVRWCSIAASIIASCCNSHNEHFIILSTNRLEVLRRRF